MTAAAIAEPVTFAPPSIAESIGLLLVMPVAWYLHELAHLLAVLALGGTGAITYTVERTLAIPAPALAVEYHGVPETSDALVKFAPQIIGSAFAAGWLAVLGWPPATWWTFVGIVGWATVTFGGGAEDWAPILPEWNEPWHRDLALGTCFIVAASLVRALPYASDPVVYYLPHLAGVIAGFVLIVIACLDGISTPNEARTACGYERSEQTNTP